MKIKSPPRRNHLQRFNIPPVKDPANTITITQSPKNLVGASAMPTGKFLRVRKVFARIYKIVHKMKP